MVSGCQLLPGKSNKDMRPKKSIFGVHGKKDADFERKVANDPFPTADSVQMEYH
jgi:hypothetical protein